MSYEVEVVDLPEQSAAVIRAHVPHDGIPAFLGAAFGDVMAAVAAQHAQVAGPPFGRYRPTEDGGWDVEAGFPVATAISGQGRVQPAYLPGGRTARTLHVGDYQALGGAYEAVTKWLIDKGYVAAGDPWECYLDGPEVANPRTQVYFPYREADAP